MRPAQRESLAWLEARGYVGAPRPWPAEARLSFAQKGLLAREEALRAAVVDETPRQLALPL